jgi:hypothetical protein
VRVQVGPEEDRGNATALTKHVWVAA